MKEISPCLPIKRLQLLGSALLFSFAALCIPLLIPQTTEARAQNESIDLSILERQRELTPLMTRAQRLQLVRIEETITQAQSDLRSGEHLADTKPSNFAPNRDVRATVERGKALMAQAKVDLERSQQALAALLQEVDAAQNVGKVPDDAIRYQLELKPMPLPEAIEAAGRKVLETSRQQGYRNLFFDQVFMRDERGITPADASLRNHVYDALVAIDGTNFNLTVPVDFTLKTDTLGQDSTIFEYENAASFARSRNALLAIEFILPEDSSSALLSLRAIDLATQRISAYELIKITDMADMADLLGVEQAEETAKLGDHAIQRIELRGGGTAIERLASLPEPYRFELKSSSTNEQVHALLAYALFLDSGLILVGSDFIYQAYGENLAEPDAWLGQANASIQIVDTETEGSFKLNLQAQGSDRSLPGGTVSVF
ncbi:MAG: hypothetical protein EA353_14545 [Puniceicoccaceae bacterium]|nr:MAG: hypothetical protein EA353_14545 [Puniceicoccaceae bacterium]